MNPSRNFFAVFLAYLSLSLLIFHRSLSYSFHYDDYSKLIFNPATESVAAAARAFWDRDMQSDDAELNTHTYRPLLVIALAMERKIFKDSATGYRLVNILLHGANAAMVALLATAYFGFGAPAAFLAGLIFLAHPAQTESVVWIVELSNVLTGFFMLLGLWLWSIRKKPLSFGLTAAIGALFMAGLLIKESAAAFPLILIAFMAGKPPQGRDRKVAITLIGILFALLIAYLVGRHSVLERIAQVNAAFSWRNYLAPIYVGLAMALSFLFVPLGSTINHQPWMSPASDVVLIFLAAALPLAITAFGVYRLFRHRDIWALLLTSFIMLWLPTSQIIPINSIFAERFLYFVMVPFGLGSGYLFEHGPRWTGKLLALYAIALVVITAHNLPHWQNDGTLWDNAVRKNPSYWHGWVQSAEWEKTNAAMCRRLGQPEPTGWLERAEEKYIRGLKSGVPTPIAADLFFRLAEINRQQGKMEDAEKHAQRGESLRRNHVQ